MNHDEMLKQRERMAELVTEARTELEKISDKTTEAEAKELEARFDAAMSDHDKIAARIEREEKLAAAEDRAQAGDGRRPDYPEGEARGEQQSDQVKEYREVFEKMVRYGAATLDKEERSVLMAKRADLPAEARAQAAGTDSAGGFTVPEGFSNELDKALKLWGPMYDGTIVRELNTANGRKLPWPTVDDTANTGRIKSENAAADDDGTDDVVFSEKELDAFVYDTGIVRIPIELLQDSAFNMESLLADLFGERLGRTANTALTTGSGSGEPNGIVTASSEGKVAAATGAITADEIIDLLHSVDPAYRASPRSRFMFNDSTLASIRKLKDGQGNYLWQMGDIRSDEPNMILGHQYSINQAMADIGTSNKPIVYGDFSRYIVRKVIEFQVLTLRERYAERFQVGMVGFKRFDGELLNTAAVKHLVNAAA